MMFVLPWNVKEKRSGQLCKSKAWPKETTIENSYFFLLSLSIKSTISRNGGKNKFSSSLIMGLNILTRNLRNACIIVYLCLTLPGLQYIMWLKCNFLLVLTTTRWADYYVVLLMHTIKSNNIFNRLHEERTQYRIEITSGALIIKTIVRTICEQWGWLPIPLRPWAGQLTKLRSTDVLCQ